jgi:hypothetical protein
MYMLERRQLLRVSCVGVLSAVFAPGGFGGKAMYQRIDKTPKLHLSKQAEVVATPSGLVKCFGAPTDESWDIESLGGFYFSGPRDETFTVYKRAYDADVSTVRELRKSFWLGDEPQEFSVGSMRDYDVPGFSTWLLDQLRA